MGTTLIVQCFGAESTSLHFFLLKFLLFQLNLVLISFWEQEDFNFANLSSVFATKKLLSLFIGKHCGLFRDIRLRFNLRSRLI